jgi:hypothetical protein
MTSVAKVCSRTECKASYGDPVRLNDLTILASNFETHLNKVNNNLHIALQNAKNNPASLEDVVERIEMAKAQLSFFIN